MLLPWLTFIADAVDVVVIVIAMVGIAMDVVGVVVVVIVVIVVIVVTVVIVLIALVLLVMVNNKQCCSFCYCYVMVVTWLLLLYSWLRLPTNAVDVVIVDFLLLL